MPSPPTRNIVSIGLVVLCITLPIIVIFRDVSTSQARILTPQCLVLGGLTVSVVSFLGYTLVAYLLREQLVPLNLGSYLQDKTDAEQLAWRKKITGLALPIMVRLMVLILLASCWGHFSFTEGLALKTTTQFGSCDLTGHVTDARAFYVSRYMLCALMLWELASMEAIHWSVLLHHVVTVFACCITTDEVLQRYALQKDVIKVNVIAALDGVGFVTFFYAALTAFEMILVLMYHLEVGHKKRQFAAMATAVCMQVCVTIIFFLVFPTILLSHNLEGSVPPGLFGMLIVVNISMFLVEMFIASVRVKIARKKWRELQDAKMGPELGPTKRQETSASESIEIGEVSRERKLFRGKSEKASLTTGTSIEQAGAGTSGLGSGCSEITRV